MTKKEFLNLLKIYSDNDPIIITSKVESYKERYGIFLRYYVDKKYYDVFIKGGFGHYLSDKALDALTKYSKWLNNY